MPPIIQFLHMGMSNKDVALRFMGIYQAQFRGLEQAGATVRFSLDLPDASADCVVCTANPQDIQQAASATKCPLILYVPPADQWFDEPLLSSLCKRIAFVYGPVLSDATAARYRQLGITYHYLPFAADPDLMRPLGMAPQLDLVFLGGLQHRRGYQPFIEPLLKRIDPQRLAFIGGGWEKYRIPTQSIAYGPLVNIFYNMAKVCINLHAPEQMRGQAVQLDLNNRVFDLAMAGCVQVSDNPQAVRMHFAESEIFAEANAEAWVERIMHTLSQSDAELQPMRQAARARALAEHTWAHRGKTFLSWMTNV